MFSPQLCDVLEVLASTTSGNHFAMYKCFNSTCLTP